MAYQGSRGARYPFGGQDPLSVFREGSYRSEELRLQRLEDLENWQVSEGEPDIRRWNILNQNGDNLGQVESLIASPVTRNVYFLIAQVGGVLGFGGKHMLVTLDKIQLDQENRHVLLDASREDLHNAVEWRDDQTVDYLQAYRYWEGREGGLRMEEREMAGMRGGEAPGVPRAGEMAGTTRAGEMETKAAETRVPPREEERVVERARHAGEVETRVPLREEELVAERERHTGEVEIGKHVETEQRTIEVPVTHTEVEVERRAVRGDVGARAEGEIGEGEVRIPVVEEEVHVEKRPVVKEEIVVRQHPETEVRQFTETVRREVPDVTEEGDVDVETKGDIHVRRTKKGDKGDIR